jgi:molybdenum cofactor biosynthesis protein MoaC
MVDVTAKMISARSATACGRIFVPRKALDLILPQPDSAEETLSPAQEKARRKGDVLSVAQLAAIMGCKKTSELIPLCHPLAITNVDVKLIAEASSDSILCTATVSCAGQTGVEMEALTAVSVGLLTVWDMLKAVAGQEMIIGDIKVTAKTGGKADYTRDPTS